MNKPILLIIVIAIIAVLATKRFFDQRKQNEINDNSLPVSYLVKVDNKKDYPYPNMRSRERDVVSPETFRYEIYFKTLSSGEVIKSIVTEEQYRGVELGREGKLTLQGTRFIRFEPN
ncbi:MULTISPECIES: DUF2500 family protein [Providencia]|uniref:DUF2500 family protein n=1 Tax=Providencia TaxID=586 RepID=UPI00197E0373|nr:MULTISPECIES: DUF2500 family protein [Providencia]HEC8330702.1 DUF2500 domain-containing protein [Providencia rettgeri]MBN4864562.1 DUF2500 domain-containing protein [Providencia stuartii]MBN4873991.1 DUF2500 domain-containing protein [Providencia stuartii]MBN4878682.1 DUF2500 domain-containing protein [Providencia stuartii]MBN4883085.1 DUF2500 domain-containing protein [Providencia stuartii]